LARVLFNDFAGLSACSRKAFKSEYQNLMWQVDKKLFQAWTDGMTGYPIVDAGLQVFAVLLTPNPLRGGSDNGFQVPFRGFLN
jgi:hypothetical protein